MLTRAPRGTRDTLPSQIYKWHHVENKIRKLCSCYGYREIRTPVFEHTELFERGVGGTTDIVQKEMYTFTDKGKDVYKRQTLSSARPLLKSVLIFQTPTL